MRYLFSLTLCWFTFQGALYSQSDIQVSSGATLKVEGAIFIEMTEMSLKNDGSVDAGTSSKITITSANTPSDVSIGGSTPVSFVQLVIDASDTITLNQNMAVSDTLFINNGLFNLNDKILTLSDDAVISGESAQDGITGPDGGNVQTSTVLNAPSAYNAGNMGLAISSPANLGATTISRGHTTPTSSVTNGRGINRFFDISPTNNSGLDATIRFCYQDSELDGITESELGLFRSTDGGTTWTYEGYDTRNATENWVELSGIDGFSMWTLASPLSASLPVELSYFEVTCVRQGVKVDWMTESEIKNDYFEVQYSVDGRNWQALEKIKGAGNSFTGQFYSYTDERSSSLNSLYRLRQVDLDGTAAYSEIKSIECRKEETVNISIFPNPVTETFFVSLKDLSDVVTDIQVSDSNGRIIAQKSVIPKSNLQEYAFSLKDFPAGNYTVYIRTEGQPKVFRMIKIQD